MSRKYLNTCLLFNKCIIFSCSGPGTSSSLLTNHPFWLILYPTWRKKQQLCYYFKYHNSWEFVYTETIQVISPMQSPSTNYLTLVTLLLPRVQHPATSSDCQRDTVLFDDESKSYPEYAGKQEPSFIFQSCKIYHSEFYSMKIEQQIFQQ